VEKKKNPARKKHQCKRRRTRGTEAKGHRREESQGERNDPKPFKAQEQETPVLMKTKTPEAIYHPTKMGRMTKKKRESTKRTHDGEKKSQTRNPGPFLVTDSNMSRPPHACRKSRYSLIIAMCAACHLYLSIKAFAPVHEVRGAFARSVKTVRDPQAQNQADGKAEDGAENRLHIAPLHTLVLLCRNWMQLQDRQSRNNRDNVQCGFIFGRHAFPPWIE
jgi:hypothetical protein